MSVQQPGRAGGKRLAAAALALTALVFLGACASSPPTRFYTLSDTAPAGQPPPGVGLVSIVSVTIPGEIDRPEIVRRSGPNQLHVSELDRWAAPLDETIRRVLSDDISRRVPNPAPSAQHSVAVDIHDFYGDAGCNVTLRALWSLRPAATAAALPVTEEIQVPSSGPCPATLAETMSIALGQLSDRIVAAMARLPPAAAAVR